MGRLFGIIVIVAGLWAAAEIYNEGTANAFGGVLARTGMVAQTKPGEDPRLGRRVGTKFGQSHADADTRRNGMLAE